MKNRRRPLTFDMMEVRITPSGAAPGTPDAPVTQTAGAGLYNTMNPTPPEFDYYSSPNPGQSNDSSGFEPVYYVTPTQP